jgi:hypothetical protein
MKTLTRRDLKNKSNTIINIDNFTIDLEKIEVSKD